MKNYLIFASLLLSAAFTLFFTSQSLYAQSIPPDTTTYWMTNESGVKIPVQRGPDNLMVKGELILRFKQGALSYSKLLTTYYDWYSRYKTHGKKSNSPLRDPSLPSNEERGFPTQLRTRLFTEKFYVDSASNICSASLTDFLKLEHGKYLQRLTTASPFDTSSLTRRGDTIGCDHYNWMVLYFDTTTNPLVLGYLLTTLFPNDIILASPEYKTEKLLKHPGDDKKNYDTCEIDLKTMINAETAWNYEVGDTSILIGSYDLGFDDRHPDLGGGDTTSFSNIGPGKHIRYGKWYSSFTEPMEVNQGHGTPSIGIMGALTNRNFHSVAGVAGGWGTLSQGSTDSIDRGTGCSFALLKDPLLGPKDYVSAIFEASAFSTVTGYGLGVHAINNPVTVFGERGAATGLIVHSALDYAYENGVVMVVARGNDGKDTLTYPACYEEPWVISVGGSIPGRIKTPPSDWGRTLDLIAPSGSTDGCAQGWGINWTTINATPVSSDSERVHPRWSFGPFAGNSAAVPHVSGSVGLLLSWFLKHPLADSSKIEPEDYGGILKSSAWRGDASRQTQSKQNSWMDSSGWGHLDVGRAFDMLDQTPGSRTDNLYILRHYHSTSGLEYGDWTTQDSTAYFFNIPWSLHAIGAISNSSLDNHHKYQLNYFGNHTIYYAKIRPVTKTIALDSIWDVNADAPLFAWGRSGGINEPSGWNMSQENFQTGWSRVTDCTGGNLLNEGIFHSQSTTFTVKTAQYDVWGYDTISRAYTAYLGHCPPDSLMGVNFSVFGRKNLAHNSVNSTADGNSSSILEVNPSVDHIEIKYFTEKGIEHPKFEIFDLLGRHITSTIQGEHASQGWNTYKLNNLSLPSGSYICRVSGSSFNQSKSFHIVR